MIINLIGLVSGLSAFIGIWWGHVGVRKIESISPVLWVPISLSVVVGLVLEALSLLAQNIYLTAACGILGVTLFWDAFEFYRQERRVKSGHAPANPKNPRHARFLEEFPDATPVDWLDRSPRGRAYSQEEIIVMKASGQ